MAFKRQSEDEVSNSSSKRMCRRSLSDTTNDETLDSIEQYEAQFQNTTTLTTNIPTFRDTHNSNSLPNSDPSDNSTYSGDIDLLDDLDVDLEDLMPISPDDIESAIDEASFAPSWIENVYGQHDIAQTPSFNTQQAQPSEQLPEVANPPIHAIKIALEQSIASQIQTGHAMAASILNDTGVAFISRFATLIEDLIPVLYLIAILDDLELMILNHVDNTSISVIEETNETTAMATNDDDEDLSGLDVDMDDLEPIDDEEMELIQQDIYGGLLNPNFHQLEDFQGDEL